MITHIDFMEPLPMKNMQIHNVVNEDQLSIAAGQAVRVLLDSGKYLDTYARTGPWKMGDNHVILVEDILGPYALCRVFPSPIIPVCGSAGADKVPNVKVSGPGQPVQEE